MPCRCFDVRYKGIDIFEEEKILQGGHVKSSEITYTAEYETVNIAHYDNLSLDEFLEKPDWYQGVIRGHYQAHNQLEAILTEEQRRKDEARRREMEARHNRGI